MTSRTWLFLGAVASLVVVRGYTYVAKRRGQIFFEPSSESLVWRPYQLVLASFLTLFAELAFIRWIAVEIRVFAYFKNLALLLCFVGFGLGCALARQSVRWPSAIVAFLGLFLVVRLPFADPVLENLSHSLGAAVDVE